MILNFGKHKGKEIFDINTSYLLWILHKNFITPDMRKEILLVLSNRKTSTKSSNPNDYFSAGKLKGKYKKGYPIKWLQVYYNTTQKIDPVLKQEILEVIKESHPETTLNLDPPRKATPPWEIDQETQEADWETLRDYLPRY